MPRTGVYTVGSIDRFNWRSRPLRPVDNVVRLAPEKITIAEALKSAGYTTGLFGKWHLGDDPAHHPRAQGFDEAITSMGRHFNFETTPPTDHPADAYLADFLTDRAVDFIRRHARTPFFLCGTTTPCTLRCRPRPTSSPGLNPRRPSADITIPFLPP